MNKIYFIVCVLALTPLRLWSAEPSAEDSSALPCLKVSSACRKLIKDNKASGLTSAQQCIDEVLQGKELKGLDISVENVADCKKVRSQLKTK